MIWIWDGKADFSLLSQFQFINVYMTYNMYIKFICSIRVAESTAESTLSQCIHLEHQQHRTAFRLMLVQSDTICCSSEFEVVHQNHPMQYQTLHKLYFSHVTMAKNLLGRYLCSENDYQHRVGRILEYPKVIAVQALDYMRFDIPFG